MSRRTSRRKFLRQAVAAAGVSAAAPLFVPSEVLGREGKTPPSERIQVGCIGMGGHGTRHNLASYLRQADARVIAVCDVDASRLAAAKKIVDEKYGKGDCASYKDFRELLERKDIDSVMISTPDHWHTLISVLAMKAGKDVQCEKPTLTIDEGKQLVKAVRKHKKVFQTSTEDRAVPVYHRIAELVRNGRIGDLKTIRVTLPSQPLKPGDATPQPIPKGLDWDMWLGPAPAADYTPDRVHFNFRWISAYSGGIVTDWGTHLFDTAQWANDTERSGPMRIEATGNFWKDGLYDTVKEYHIEYTYRSGVKMIVDNGGTGIRFEGSKGWVEVPSWRAPLRASDPKILESKIGDDEIKLFTNPAGEHRNFLDCVKTREDPYFPVDIGHRVSTLCHLGNLAVELGRPLDWDPKGEVFPGDAEANAKMSRPMRAPWKLEI